MSAALSARICLTTLNRKDTLTLMETTSVYYQAIKDHYAGCYAERTGLPYIKHIDDGLRILDHIGTTEAAKAAYCIHPIIQGDGDLAAFMRRLRAGDTLYSQFDADVIALAVEYRNCANRYLSFHYGRDTRVPRLSPLQEVNDMLIADKVQNYHDFMAQHYGTHKDSDQLYACFHAWFDVLDINVEDLLPLCDTAV